MASPTKKPTPKPEAAVTPPPPMPPPVATFIKDERDGSVTLAPLPVISAAEALARITMPYPGHASTCVRQRAQSAQCDCGVG